jgi:flagellar biosynthesis anti-sigma factor FlgM
MWIETSRICFGKGGRMNIKSLDNNEALNAYRSQTERAAGGTARAEKERGASARSEGDSLRLSREASLLAAARNTAMREEDVRLERVEELKARVESGTYVVDNFKTAAGLLREEAELFR